MAKRRRTPGVRNPALQAAKIARFEQQIRDVIARTGSAQLADVLREMRKGFTGTDGNPRRWKNIGRGVVQFEQTLRKHTTFAIAHNPKGHPFIDLNQTVAVAPAHPVTPTRPVLPDSLTTQQSDGRVRTRFKRIATETQTDKDAEHASNTERRFVADIEERAARIVSEGNGLPLDAYRELAKRTLDNLAWYNGGTSVRGQDVDYLARILLVEAVYQKIATRMAERSENDDSD